MDSHGATFRQPPHRPQSGSHQPAFTTGSWIALTLELFVGPIALVSGLLLMVAPSVFHFERGYLRHSPFDSYLVPGLLLAVFVGLLSIGVALGALGRATWAQAGHLLAGLALTAFILVEIAMVGFNSPLQPLGLLIGLAIVAAGLLDSGGT